MELLAQAKEVTEGQDKHLFGMSIQPLSDLLQNRLSEKHKLKPDTSDHETTDLVSASAETGNWHQNQRREISF